MMKSSIEDEVKRFQAEADRAFAEAVPRRWRAASGPAWRPPTDVYESDDSVVVAVEIAGLEEGDYQLTLTKRTLTVSGRRIDPAHKRAYHQMEIRYGEFRTQIYLPWALQDAEEGIEAVYEDGFLRIELHKAAPRRVPVRHETDDSESITGT